MENPTRTGGETAARQAASSAPCRVLVLGGGVAGLTAAFELKRRLGKRADITVISDRGQFLLPMGLLDVPFRRRPDEAGFPIGPALTRKGIRFRVARVDRVDAARRLVLAREEEIPYDFLLIATGPEVDSRSVPGLGGEFNAAHFLHTESGALETAAAVEQFLRSPGAAVVGVAGNAAYLSPAYEFMLCLDAALRRQGTRDQANLTFVTSEPYLGYLNVGSARARHILERAFAARRIAVHANLQVSRLRVGQVDLANGTRLDSALTIMLPAFRGTAGIWKTSGLTDAQGYVPVDGAYRHRQYPEIFAAGAVADAEAVTQSRAKVPNTGYVATSMAKTAARSIAAAVASRAPGIRALPRLMDIRVLDGGNMGLLLLGFGRVHSLRLALRLPGQTAHRLKSRLNRYVLWKLRTGRSYLP